MDNNAFYRNDEINNEYVNHYPDPSNSSRRPTTLSGLHVRTDPIPTVTMISPANTIVSLLYK